MRVLGVDPGLTRCGLGVVDGVPGQQLRLVDVGVVGTPPGLETPERLRRIAAVIDAWIESSRPEVVAIERVFAQQNLRTVMGTAQVSAVVMLAAARSGLPVALHTPSEVKAAVTGDGRADKHQVAAMVVRLLRLEKAPRPVDATDALALAICHVWRGSAAARIEAARLSASSHLESARVESARVQSARVQSAGSADVPLPAGIDQ